MTVDQAFKNTVHSLLPEFTSLFYFFDLSIHCFLSFFILGVGDDLVRTLRYVHLKCISFAAVEVRRLFISILHTYLHQELLQQVNTICMANPTLLETKARKDIYSIKTLTSCISHLNTYIPKQFAVLRIWINNLFVYFYV